MQLSHDSCFVYIGTGSAGIFGAILNLTTATLSPARQIADLSKSGFLALHPSKPYLYATYSSGPAKTGAINAFSVDTMGGLTLLNSQRHNDLNFVHIDPAPQGDLLITASYDGNTAVAFPVLADGSLGPASWSYYYEHAGSQVDQERQFEPFPHSFTFNLQGSHAYLCDLGADKMFIYKRDGNALVPSEQAVLELPAGSGPRHMAKHSDHNTLYILNELNATITVCRHDKGHLNIQQTISTLPETVTTQNSAAEIVTTKDGKFLYCSNRAHGDEHDCITSYTILPDGQLELLAFTPTDRHPRHFCLDPSEQFLLVANRDSNNVVLYHRDIATGRLERTRQEIVVPEPVCIRTLERNRLSSATL